MIRAKPQACESQKAVAEGLLDEKHSYRQTHCQIEQFQQSYRTFAVIRGVFAVRRSLFRRDADFALQRVCLAALVLRPSSSSGKVVHRYAEIEGLRHRGYHRQITLNVRRRLSITDTNK